MFLPHRQAGQPAIFFAHRQAGQPAIFFAHRQAGQPVLRLTGLPASGRKRPLRLAGLPAYAAKTPSKNNLRLGWAAQPWSVENSPFIRWKNLKP